jgi:hypothetical protein
MAEVKPVAQVSAPASKVTGGKAGVNPLVAVLRMFFIDRHNRLNLKVLNLFLLAGVVFLAVRFVNIISASVKKLGSINLSVAAEPARSDMKEKAALGGLADYLAKVKKRNIFEIGAGKKPDDLIAAGPSSKAVEATQNLRLVGISWSDSPDAMIEDIKSLKTFFVKKDQMIGDVKVETITKEKVVLRYGQELIEIK